MSEKIKRNVEQSREHMIYGCEIEPFVKSVEESLAFQLSGPGMIIMSILSDAQEEINLGMSEKARQTINRAKHLTMRYLPLTRR